MREDLVADEVARLVEVHRRFIARPGRGGKSRAT
jgi:hypothetical protein